MMDAGIDKAEDPFHFWKDLCASALSSRAEYPMEDENNIAFP